MAESVAPLWVPPSHRLQASLLAVQLHLDLVQFLDLLVVALRLVAHQGAIEVDGEDEEDDSHRDHDDGGGQRRLPAARRSAGAGGAGAAGAFLGVVLGATVDGQELDPAEEHDLGQEQQDAQRRGEPPGQLDVVVHALVRWLADRVEVVDVADGLHVGQDAGADEQGEEVNGHQHRGAHGEGDEQLSRVAVLQIQLHLHHGHLQHKTPLEQTLWWRRTDPIGISESGVGKFNHYIPW